MSIMEKKDNCPISAIMATPFLFVNVCIKRSYYMKYNWKMEEYINILKGYKMMTVMPDHKYIPSNRY